jgi:hypothetical protein
MLDVGIAVVDDPIDEVETAVMEAVMQRQALDNLDENSSLSFAVHTAANIGITAEPRIVAVYVAQND